MARVAVLLRPCAVSAPAAAPSSGRPTVCVMGMHRSGTKALAQYVTRFFEVDVEPASRPLRRGRFDTGTVCLAGGFRTWKHAVPCAPLGLPAHGGPVVAVLLTVRDPCSWMCSLAQHAYEIFPSERRKRRQGSLHWMLEGVQLRTSREFHADPNPGARFASVPDLWAAYVGGYLRGSMLVAGGDPAGMASSGDADVAHVRVVRFEDIVLRPDAVVAELARLGLPRNGRPFAPIEEVVGGAAGSRDELVARLEGALPAIDPEVRAAIHLQLQSHQWMLQHLGYVVP